MDVQTVTGIVQLLTGVSRILGYVEARGVTRDQVFHLMAQAEAQGGDVSAIQVAEYLGATAQEIAEVRALVEVRPAADN